MAWVPEAIQLDLAHSFVELPDSRYSYFAGHALTAIMVAAVLAVICGCNGW